MKRNSIIILPGIYLSIVFFIFNFINEYIFLGLIFLIILYAFFVAIKYLVLLPFCIYPFLFLIKNEANQNLIIAMLPELIIIFSSIIFILYKKIITSNITLFSLIILHSLITILIGFFHMHDFSSLPILFRQFFIPLFFMIIFIYASEKNNTLPKEAIRISILSFGIITILALLNYYDVIYLYKYMTPAGSYVGRPFFGCTNDIIAPFIHCVTIGEYSNQMVRMELFLGGSIGSAGSILMVLALVTIILNNKSYKFLKYFSLTFITCSVLSMSISIIIPIFFFIIVKIVTKKNYLILIPFSFIIMLLITTKISFFGTLSPFEYFNVTIFSGISNYFSEINILNLLFGSGPVITSNRFVFLPDRSLLDIGIFRIFSETGILNFILFFSILVHLFKKLLWLQIHHYSYYSVSLFVIFCSLLTMIHGNMVIFPPFYPIFIAVTAGILTEHKLKTSII